MFNLFTPKSKNNHTISFKLSGLHCTSCAVNIDLSLEELEGIINANTSYQKSQVQVQYNPEKIDPKKIQKVLSDLGYESVLEK